MPAQPTVANQIAALVCELEALTARLKATPTSPISDEMAAHMRELFAQLEELETLLGIGGKVQ